jgi:hypothetical protein
MRIIIALLIGLLLGSVTALQALAQGGNHTGIVQNVHLNQDIPGRGPCFHMQPAIPGSPGNWACVWRDNALYKETMVTLLSAMARGSVCVIFWHETDASGLPRVILLDCQR